MNLKSDKTSKDMTINAISRCKKGLHTTQVLQNIQSGKDRQRERNLNSKTLFYHACSLGSVKNLSNN